VHSDEHETTHSMRLRYHNPDYPGRYVGPLLCGEKTASRLCQRLEPSAAPPPYATHALYTMRP